MEAKDKELKIQQRWIMNRLQMQLQIKQKP